MTNRGPAQTFLGGTSDRRLRSTATHPHAQFSERGQAETEL